MTKKERPRKDAAVCDEIFCQMQRLFVPAIVVLKIFSCHSLIHIACVLCASFKLLSLSFNNMSSNATVTATETATDPVSVAHGGQPQNPISDIYRLIQQCTINDTSDVRAAKVAQGLVLFHACTTEMLWKNQKERQHPVLHEMVEQWLSTSELCKKVWDIEHLKPLWDCREYVDQYGLTVLERLVTSNSDLSRRTDLDYSQDILWMAEKLHVKPTDRSDDAEPWEIKVENYRVM